MRENRPSGSEGGAGDNPLFLPLSPRPEPLPNSRAVRDPVASVPGWKTRRRTTPPSRPWPVSVVSLTLPLPILGWPSQVEPLVLPPSLVSGARL